MAGTTKKSKNGPKPAVKSSGRSEVTRDKILAAARQVFSEHPYHMATIRMIGTAGGFDHQLIAYYFPTKAGLFEAVLSEVCDEFYKANLSWYEGLDKLPLADSFSLFLDRFLEYHFQNPSPMRLLALNAALIERLEEIPGYQHIPDVLSKTRANFENNIRLNASPEDVERFINTFNTAIINYLGAAPSQSQILGLSSDSDEYRKWVKDTLMFVFLPVLRSLISAVKSDSKKI